MTAASTLLAAPAAEPISQTQLAGAIAAYTQITQRLQESHDRLAREVARLRAELESKNRELERRSRLAALGQMAAGMAHEIRNPLGGIALYASLLASRLMQDAEGAAIATRIATGVDRLNALVNDILAFAGEIQPQKRPILLSAVLGEAHELARGRLEAAGTRLSIRCECDVEFQGDAHLLVRAIANLLFNACDAAGEGVVAITAAQVGGELEISVADSGPGVPAELLDRIFNPFFTTKDRGTGLGLAIVHRIVESHGGRIAVRNAPDGQEPGGAHFVIRLPTGAAQGAGTGNESAGLGAAAGFSAGA
jgi:signal transduction histidine kinase